MVSGPATWNRFEGRPAAAPLRAALAVLALYAVLLQTFLGGLMPMPGPADGLCAQHVQVEQVPGTTVPPGHGDCCTAVQAAGAALPPRANPEPVAWTAGGGLGVDPRMLEVPAARAPPGRIAAPRGPPAA